MKWALVLALVLCGGTLSFGNEGYVESESEESMDKFLRDLKEQNLYLEYQDEVATSKEKDEIPKEDSISDACSSSPCENSGICKVKGDSFECECVGQFSGPLCETVSDACSSSPCKNSGICKVKEDSFECECVGQFSGPLCETECDCGARGKCDLVGGVKTCVCDKGFLEKQDGKCHECDCGDKGKCAFVKDVRTCTCNEGYSEKPDGKCQACDCGSFGKCSFEGDEMTCECQDGFKENKDKICKECNCGTNGDCSFDEKNKRTCDCHSGHAEKDGKCRHTCHKDEDPCEHNRPCEGSEDKGFFCNCGAKLIGDKCEKVTDCETGGSYENCVTSGGKCAYFKEKEKETVNCTCSGDDLKLVAKKDKCQKKCSANNKCENGGTCTDELCACLTGTSGDYCEKVDGCGITTKVGDQDETLTKTCEKAGAKCIFDTVEKLAKCKCNNEDLDYQNGKCSSIWCQSNSCSEAKSDCTYENGAAFCKCKKVDEYYNYRSNDCIDIKACPLVPCKKNENCRGGKCLCEGNYEKDKTDKDKEDKSRECIRKKLCEKSKPCYKGADCKEGDIDGTVRCDCPSDNFYNAKSSSCEDGKCFLPGKREKCVAACPDEKLERKDGDCVGIKEEDRCTTDCGEFGYCLKKGKADACVCIKDLAKLNKDGKCVLNAEVCASKAVLKDDPNKCNCSGTYKYSKNEITCERLTCGDQEAQDDCKSKGGVCEDNKDLTKGYKCKMTAISCNEKTVQVCSEKQQACYNDESGVATCVCPPGYSAGSDKKTCVPGAQNAYLLQKLPVISSEFMKDNSVNEIMLNSYIIQSMKMIYKNLENGFLHHYKISDDKEIILCDVWLQFNEDAKLYISRWKSEAKNQTDGSWVLPPALLLSKEKFEEVKQEPLEFCSDVVVHTACGQGAACKDKKCICKSGFRVVGPTVQTIGENTILRCEDIDECLENKHNCKSNSECVNTIGSYACKCNKGYHKKDPTKSDADQEECVELCTPNPCKNGDCKVNEDKIECSCSVGYKGSFCSEDDNKLKQAQHSTKIVGAVLGTLLAVTFVVIIVYIVRLKKNSYSEDFAPAPRDNAEMVERSRPLRGVSNRGYQ